MDWRTTCVRRWAIACHSRLGQKASSRESPPARTPIGGQSAQAPCRSSKACLSEDTSATRMQEMDTGKSKERITVKRRHVSSWRRQRVDGLYAEHLVKTVPGGVHKVLQFKGQAAASGQQKRLSNNRFRKQPRRQSNDQISSRRKQLTHRSEVRGGGNDKVHTTMTQRSTRNRTAQLPKHLQCALRKKSNAWGMDTCEADWSGKKHQVGKDKYKGAEGKRNLDIFAGEPKTHDCVVHDRIMREVYYHDWLSNPVMVKKSGDVYVAGCAGGLHRPQPKACPQDCYPLPVKIAKGNPLCGYPSSASLAHIREALFWVLDRKRSASSAWSCPRQNKAVIQLPFTRTMKSVRKKESSDWNTEQEKAFTQLKQLIAALHASRTPTREGVDYRLPILRAWTPISAVSLLTDRGLRTNTVYLVFSSRPQVRLITDQPFQTERSEKDRILADFLIEKPETDIVLPQSEVKLPEPWILFTDGSSCVDGSGAGLILTQPGRKWNSRSHWFLLNSQPRNTRRNTKPYLRDCIAARYGVYWSKSEEQIWEMEISTVIEEQDPTGDDLSLEFIKLGRRSLMNKWSTGIRRYRAVIRTFERWSLSTFVLQARLRASDTIQGLWIRRDPCGFMQYALRTTFTGGGKSLTGTPSLLSMDGSRYYGEIGIYAILYVEGSISQPMDDERSIEFRNNRVGKDPTEGIEALEREVPSWREWMGIELPHVEYLQSQEMLSLVKWLTGFMRIFSL
ncbi:hypothetical protein Tco_1475543 [Tanacetum coccineum]